MFKLGDLYMNGKTVGDIGEAKVLCEFIELGIQVYLPYGENSKVDIVANFNNKLNKIQVKTCSHTIDDGKYNVYLKNTSLRSDGNSVVSLPTKEDIDFFAIYCLEREKPILVPFELLENKKSITIHFDNQVFGSSLLEKNFYFDIVTNSNYVFDILKEQKKDEEQNKNYCVDCGTKITSNVSRCKKCAAIYRRKVSKTSINNRISREELKNKIRTQSFLSIAKEYKVSDNAVRRWCDYYNLPRKKSDISQYSEEDWSKI